MKKIFAVIPAAVLSIGALTGVTASACGRHNANTYRMPNATVQNYNRNVRAQSSTTAVNTQARALHYYTDSNNDGICDCFNGGICLSNGLCSSYYYGQGNFIDNNNDGICDNCAAGACNQHGYHHIGGIFVDNNGDGICDNCADGVCTQHGTGLGNHHGKGCHR